MTRLAIAIVRGWTWLYTSAMAPALRDARRAEIESDLWECQHDPDAVPQTRAVLVLLRLIVGLPDDLAWCAEHLAEQDAVRGRTIVMASRAVGAALLIAVLLIISADASRRRSGFVFDPPEAPQRGRQTLLVAGIVATVGPTMAATDEFEAASVKPNRSGAGLLRLSAERGGRFTAVNVSLAMLIRYAYRRSDVEMSGGPAWVDVDRFDVVAKAAFDAPADQIRLMLRALLATRFGLRVHEETRDLPVYALMMARSDARLGPQLRHTAADCRNAPPLSPGGFVPDTLPECGFFGPVGRLVKLGFRGVTMTEVSKFLQPMVRRVVVDRTGLEGYFDGEFDFTVELGPPPPPPGVPDRFDRQAFPTVFTVFPEQLGLKLDSERGPVSVLVIDSAVHPMPD